MAEEFNYDVFLSHSVKDKPIVRELAERLRKDGLKVWLDEWVLKPGDHVQAKVEEGLEQSRVLVLCMSANAFGSDWAQLEAGTFRFRDPMNRERRFIPLRLDAAPIKGSLAQFHYINWFPEIQNNAYEKLLEACRPPDKPLELEADPQSRITDKLLTKLEINKLVSHYIGVYGGYLGDFSYKKHYDFYVELDLDIDPNTYEGTTRERFIKILSEGTPSVQARILEGILNRYPIGSSELRTHERHDEIAGWIARLRA
ncbi:MAG: toll/interleukin-1 receptor domain-containing protein [Acidobacteria bacterium]|nr:toll/interleukin-1 receptor domain-containing protein [Acidobacteriota bacterium]